MIEKISIAILIIVIFAQSIAMPPSVAQTVPAPCATATRRPTKTPWAFSTSTPTATPPQGIGEPVMIEYGWLPLVGGQP